VEAAVTPLAAALAALALDCLHLIDHLVEMMN